jgi:methylenetetrahydrofolate--tRNA-(uracil-5-)-methyltransferase
MDREEYDRFLNALLAAEAAEAKEWEKLDYFEGCLPIEVLARRGRDTLRFGPMKPVGLRDPRTGRRRGRWCNCARRICAPTATTWWAFRIT